MNLRGTLLSLASVAALSALLAACDGAGSSPGSGPAPTTAAATATALSTATATSAAAPTTAPTAAPTPVQIELDKARSLPAGSRFRDLVRVARESAGKTEGTGCLLKEGRSGEGWALAAPLDKPAATLVDPPADLDALLTNGQKKKPFSDVGMRILTPAGSSEGGEYLDLATFTPASRLVLGGLTPILIATDKGIYLGLPNLLSDGHPLTEADREQITTSLLPQAKAWIITGEGDAPMERVAEALSLISRSSGAILLASPLPKAGKAKKRASRYEARVEKGQPYACSTRTEPGIEAGPIGDYGPGGTFKLAEKFDAAVAGCQSNGAGGSIHVRMRIDPTGKLVEACAETDDTGDADARKCVVESARKLSFPPPSKPGFVNFGTAAVFAGKKITALCDR